MIWVGLTGGIASGKSTVSRLLRQEGAFIIDADSIAHAVIRKGAEAYPAVVRFFGNDILDPSGEIHRKRLGDIIFGDPHKRVVLNQIVHPYIFKRAESERRSIVARNPRAVVVFDAALLIETEAYLEMDWVLLVYVDRATQIDRLMRRDNLTREEAERRVNSQMDLEDKVRKANEIIDTRKPLAELEREVRTVYARLRSRA